METETTNTVQINKESIFEKISTWLLVATSILMPIFFVPHTLVSGPYLKTTFFFLFVVLAFVSFLIGLLKNGKVLFPKGIIFWSFICVPIILLLSSIFTTTSKFIPSLRTLSKISLWGYGFETGTFAFISTLFVFAFLVFIFLRSKQRVFNSYLLFLLVTVLLIVFHAVRFAVGPGVLSYGFFPTLTSNTLGSWSDLGIFFGFSALLSLLTIEMLRINKVFRVLLWCIFVASLVFLAVVNYSVVWITLGVFSLILFAYFLSSNKLHFRTDKATPPVSSVASSTGEATMTKFSVTSIVLLVCAFVFVVLFSLPMFSVISGGKIGSNFGDIISTKLGIQNVEARPSWQATLVVAKETLKGSPFLGTGPNNFDSAWLLHKPTEINESAFWSSSFSYGVGFIPTFLVTSGVLGVLAWLFLLGTIIFFGIRATLYGIQDPFSRYITISSFVITLYFWTMMVFAVPSATILVICFFMTGVFVASLARENFMESRQIRIFGNSKMSFPYLLIIVFILIGSLSFGYFSLEKMVASVYFERSVAFAQAGDLDKSFSDIARALTLNPTDVYYRASSDLFLAKLNIDLSKKDFSQDELKKSFQENLGGALSSAEGAIKNNSLSYQNWMTLGGIYGAIVPLKINNSYENALSAYKEAAKYNPKDPSIPLTLARMEASRGDYKMAKENILNALKLRTNYTDAIFLLAQIQMQEGNVKDAINSVEAATLTSPNSPVLFFQLGLLKYNEKDYRGSIVALERAISLLPNYANAKYYLGLNYYEVGRKDEAVAFFSELSEQNPDNADVLSILENLKAGKAPLTKASTNKKTTPPLKEEN